MRRNRERTQHVAASTDNVDLVELRGLAERDVVGIEDLENFREHFHKGILVYLSLKGSKLTDTKITGPKITYFSLTTEAPDETASGDWMKMVCRAGLAHTRAVLSYLSTGKNRINYETKEYQSSISRSVFRKRPVLPYEKKKIKE